MIHTAFAQVALILAAGMAMQVIAARLAIPGIVLLLLAGVALGPDGIGAIDPRVLGAARDTLVSLSVTVILFEGALGLELRRVRGAGRSLLSLLTLGAVVSFAIGTAAARVLLHLPLEIAALYGALMIVTGPTVVTPLLARIRVNRRVRELLVGEGVLIDPLGAIVALVIAEWVVGRHALEEAGTLVVIRLAVGALVGSAAGLAVAAVLRRRIVPEDLAGPVVLSAAILGAGIANTLSPEAGLMAAVVQGVVLANARVEGLGRLREFKERITVLLLSFLFVLLASDLRVADVVKLGWQGAATVAVVAWVARPVAVALSTWRSELSWRERAFVAWICPRGIVAAAVAGLFRLLLDEAGIPGGAELQALVFLTVALTVVVQGVTAGPIAGLLGLDFASLGSTVIIGADALGRRLAQALAARGRDVCLVDRSRWNCQLARAEGLRVVEGDALDAQSIEEAGTRWADTVVALTRNPELNQLVIGHVREQFRPERLLWWDAREQEDEGTDGAGRLFPGAFPGIDGANEALRSDRLREFEREVTAEETGPISAVVLPDASFALLLERAGSALVATTGLRVVAGDRLVCVGPRHGRPAPTSGNT